MKIIRHSCYWRVVLFYAHISFSLGMYISEYIKFFEIKVNLEQIINPNLEYEAINFYAQRQVTDFI